MPFGIKCIAILYDPQGRNSRCCARVVKKLRAEKTTKIQAVEGDLAQISRPDETRGLDLAQRAGFKGISRFGVF